MGQVAGKVAIVTGGASGIGKACALTLAREGAAVMVTDVQDGQPVVDEIVAAGGKAHFRHQDVVEEETWIKVVQECEERYGALHVLVANAGIGIGGPVTEFSLADWKRQIAINLDGVFLGTKHGIPAMRRAGSGSIIMISSLAGMQGAMGLSAYCATKGGVRLFAKAVAVECARLGDNIRANSVHPGVIDTPIWTKINPGGGELIAGVPQNSNAIDPSVIAAAMVPGGKIGYPEDIANGVLFLASDASRYMTGAELVIDGGVFAG
jgi:NAD(P)-dependent dehydrogenase (short-subunit alcohol dehydrogenase family)